MAFEWVADCDPSPPKKKRGSSGRRTRGPTSSKISVREEVPNEVPEPNPVYVEFLRMKGIYLESPEHTFGGLDRYLKEQEQSDCGESIGKSAEANVGVELHDPQYLLFIENLRCDGSEVVVEVEPHSGLKEPLRYDTEKAQRSLEPSLERENDVVEEEKRENDTAKSTRNISGEGERGMSRPAVIKGTSEELCVEVEANDQMELDRENVTCQRTNTGEAEKRVEPSSERKSDEVVELRNLVDDEEGNSDKISRKRKRRENIKEKSVNNDHEEVTDRETKGKAHKRMEPPIEKENAHSSKRTEGSSRKESRVVSWDDSYLAFMLCLRGDDDLCVYTNSKKQVKYPEEEEEEEEKEEEEEVNAESSSSDVEILSPEDPSWLETKMGFVTSKSKSSFDAYGEMSQMTPPELREKMIAELKRPYDATEYNNLWKEIKIRKPQEKWRDLRGGRERTYQTNKTCNSYLKKHYVLQKKVEQLDGNSPAILNLMRGFFFWLKHVPENMFQPWTDPECLKILPPTPAADYAPTLPSPDASAATLPSKGKKTIKKAKIERY